MQEIQAKRKAGGKHNRKFERRSRNRQPHTAASSFRLCGFHRKNHKETIPAHKIWISSIAQSISFLSKTIELWNKIIEHRSLINSRTGLFVTGQNIKPYDFNQLSDGEKAVFYYIGHVLLAPHNSYIIVDEPENHLHLTICNKLWDELEKNRPDCKFIYLTHNLNFATTRSDSTILWNKKFIPPNDWDFEILPEDEIIPEILIMEMTSFL